MDAIYPELDKSFLPSVLNCFKGFEKVGGVGSSVPFSRPVSQRRDLSCTRSQPVERLTPYREVGESWEAPRSSAFSGHTTGTTFFRPASFAVPSKKRNRIIIIFSCSCYNTIHNMFEELCRGRVQIPFQQTERICALLSSVGVG